MAEQKRRVVPPVYLLLTVLAMGAMHHWLPLYQWTSRPWSWAGLLPVLLGLGVTVTAALSFMRAGTPIVPFEKSTALVTSGLFRFTRNPMYLGMVLLLGGSAILFGSVGALLPIPLFVWVIVSDFIHCEERFMEELFGAEYLAYKQKVRRWL
ncbi:MAG: isoprenylcysteine carboxylmethyltransferase family protein [Gammaproteobacteria bacterium]|nr:isoprenylcysteine carboxylmethyltransferase family protein [Gammaproteobacteria bacterium]